MTIAWSTADHKKAIKLYTDGYSASQIGVHLGRTRNAVLGHLNRSGVVGQKRVARPTKPTEPLAARPKRTQSQPMPKVDPNPEGVKLLSTEVWNPLPGSKPVPIEHVTGCRWPINDPRDDDFCMCNEPRVDKSSYCASHKRASEPRA